MPTEPETSVPPLQGSIVVLISGRGSNLQALIDACTDGRIHGRISAVISNVADAAGLERARAAGIATRVVDHRDYAGRDAFDAALIRSIDESTPQLVVLAGFMRILTPQFVNHYTGRLLNIHPSLLPEFRGLNTHQRALDAGVKEHGASVHFVTEELDGGPVVAQIRVPVINTDTADTLAARVLAAEHMLYPTVIDWFCSGRLRLGNQGVELDGTPLRGPEWIAGPELGEA